MLKLEVSKNKQIDNTLGRHIKWVSKVLLMYISVIKDSGEHQYSGHPAQVQFYQLMLIKQLMFSPHGRGHSVNRAWNTALWGRNTVIIFTVSDRNNKMLHASVDIFYPFVTKQRLTIWHTQKPIVWHQLLKKERLLLGGQSTGGRAQICLLNQCSG